MFLFDGVARSAAKVCGITEDRSFPQPSVLPQAPSKSCRHRKRIKSSQRSRNQPDTIFCKRTFDHGASGPRSSHLRYCTRAERGLSSRRFSSTVERGRNGLSTRLRSPFRFSLEIQRRNANRSSVTLPRKTARSSSATTLVNSGNALKSVTSNLLMRTIGSACLNIMRWKPSSGMELRDSFWRCSRTCKSNAMHNAYGYAFANVAVRRLVQKLKLLKLIH